MYNTCTIQYMIFALFCLLLFPSTRLSSVRWLVTLLLILAELKKDIIIGALSDWVELVTNYG